ncbi:MAG: hypothetical protein H7Y43_06405, partial [Akkermansiaceae bacterium]|nr:hypothetical protein [Verrucomicrobiales bacterium]
TVTGPGSTWSTLNDLFVGDADGNNRLFVNNGGTVTSGSSLVLGDDATSQGNLLSVANSTVAVTNASGTGTLDVRNGKVDFNGGVITADRLLMTNETGSFTFNNGTLITRSATINNDGASFSVGANAGTSPAGATFANTTATTIPALGAATPYPSVINIANVGGAITRVTVTLSNLSHTFPGDLDILLVGPGGQKVMLMSDAGGTGDLTGVNLAFTDDAASPLPSGSLITEGTYRPTDYDPGDAPPGSLPTGPYSTSLADFNGSSANGAWSLYVLDDAGGDSGSVGAWSLKIGTTGPTTFANGSLIAINDAALATPYPSAISVTNLAGLVSRVTVTVSNFTHTATRDVDLLLVNPEGTAVALMIGAGSGGTTGATLTFDDAAPSLLPFFDSIVSGTYRPTPYTVSILPAPAPAGPYSPGLASFNGSNPNGGWSLFVSDRVSNNTGAINNGWSLKIETQPTATWDVRSNSTPTTVAGSLIVGGSAANSALLVTNGGNLSVSSGSYLGSSSSSSNNLAVIAGPNSIWRTGISGFGSGFGIGLSSSFNSVVITNGARVDCANATAVIGSTDSAHYNQVTVTGTGSACTNIGTSFVIGQAGSFNSLLITNGAAVSSQTVTLGNQPQAADNLAMVTGAGSIWNNSGDFRLGFSGRRNELMVSSGAVLVNNIGEMGHAPGAINNRAVVTGPGTLWTNRGSLTIGYNAIGNQLVVSNGAVVAATDGSVGRLTDGGFTSGNNTAVVTGPGSV